jgi:hypothetical protein
MSDDFELERIRLEKMKAMMKAQEMRKIQEERAKNQPTLADKLDMLLNVLAEPQASQYLAMIKQRNIEVYNKIRMNLLPPQIMQEIDELMMYLARGQIRRNIIGLTEVQQLERKILGIESQIIVKRRDQDAQSLTTYLKEEESGAKK